MNRTTLLIFALFSTFARAGQSDLVERPLRDRMCRLTFLRNGVPAGHASGVLIESDVLATARHNFGPASRACDAVVVACPSRTFHLALTDAHRLSRMPRFDLLYLKLPGAVVAQSRLPMAADRDEWITLRSNLASAAAIGFGGQDAVNPADAERLIQAVHPEPPSPALSLKAERAADHLSQPHSLRKILALGQALGEHARSPRLWRVFTYLQGRAHPVRLELDVRHSPKFFFSFFVDDWGQSGIPGDSGGAVVGRTTDGREFLLGIIRGGVTTLRAQKGRPFARVKTLLRRGPVAFAPSWVNYVPVTQASEVPVLDFAGCEAPLIASSSLTRAAP